MALTSSSTSQPIKKKRQFIQHGTAGLIYRVVTLPTNGWHRLCSMWMVICYSNSRTNAAVETIC